MDNKYELISPELADKRKCYNWDRRYQQEILALLLQDRMFLIQSMGLIKPEYFEDFSFSVIASSMLEYFTKYSHVPSEFTMRELIREKIKDDKKYLKTIVELESCFSIKTGGTHKEYCIDKITTFAKEQALKTAIQNSVDILQKGKDDDRWNKIENEFQKALRIERNYDLGLNYFNTIEERYREELKEIKNLEVFSSGFKGIDENISNGGLKRGEIGAIMALPGVGKSIFLIKFCATNLARGKKVLYITLEMNQSKIAKRFDSMIAYLRMSELKYDNINIIKEKASDFVAGYNDTDRLRIKYFPAGTADVSTITAYLSQASMNNFKPDLIAIDYIGEMKDDYNVKTHESRQRTMRDLRSLAAIENICIVTALQPNRTARQQQAESMIDDDSIGDSFGQSRPLDALWSLNVNNNESKAGIARLFIIKHRDGQSRISIYLKKCDDRLDFEEISRQRYEMMLQNAISEQTESKKNPVESYSYEEK